MGSAGSPGQPPPGCARGVGEGWGSITGLSGSSSLSGQRWSSQLVVSWGEGCSRAAQVPVTHAHAHSHTLTLTSAGSRMQAHSCTTFTGPQPPRSSNQVAPEPRRGVIDSQEAPKTCGCTWHPSHYLFRLCQSLGWGTQMASEADHNPGPAQHPCPDVGVGAGLLPPPGEGSRPWGGGWHRWAADKKSQERRGLSGRW